MDAQATALKVSLKAVGVWAEPGQAHPLPPDAQRIDIGRIVSQLDGHLLIVAYWVLLLLWTMRGNDGD